VQNIHYWRNEPDQAAAVLARARPVVEAQGTLARKQNFYMSLALQRARQTRYRIDGEILGNVRAGVDAAPQGGDEREIAWTVFCLGFFLLWHGDLADAQEQFRGFTADCRTHWRPRLASTVLVLSQRGCASPPRRRRRAFVISRRLGGG